MLARVLALLFAVVMMVGGAVQVASAAPDVACALDASAADDVADPSAPIVPQPVAVAAPLRRGSVEIAAPQGPAVGRAHADLVYRPPR